MLTSFNDVFQFTWGKMLGNSKIVPSVSPNKTWEGFIGGILTTAVLAYLIRFLTPLSDVQAIITGLIIGVFGFEDTTGEDQVETSADQVSIVTQDALPMFTFTYKNGYVFNQALQALKGFANWDVFIYTTKGIFMATDYAKANIKGFNCGMFQPTGYKLTSGSVREFSTVKMQFLDANEFNQRGTFFSYDELGFSALEIDDPIQTVVSYETAPSNSDTEVTVYVKDFGNASTDLNSLFSLVTDYVVKINGVAETVNSVTVNGSHNILEFTTALATSDVVTVSLNGVVEDVNLNYYKSNTLSAVVVA